MPRSGRISLIKCGIGLPLSFKASSKAILQEIGVNPLAPGKDGDKSLFIPFHADRMVELPHDLPIQGHFKEPSAVRFRDQGVAVGQTKGLSSEGTVERLVITAHVLPDDLHG